MSSKMIQLTEPIYKKPVLSQDTEPDDKNVLWVDTSDDNSNLTIDNTLSSTSTNPIENRAVTNALDTLETTVNGKSSSTHTHTVEYTPAGSVASTFTGSAATSGEPSATTSVYSITDVGSLPSLTASVENRCLTLSFSAGSLPTRSSVAVSSSGHTHSVTANGTVSSTFTGAEKALATSSPE